MKKLTSNFIFLIALLLGATTIHQIRPQDIAIPPCDSCAAEDMWFDPTQPPTEVAQKNVCFKPVLDDVHKYIMCSNGTPIKKDCPLMVGGSRLYLGLGAFGEINVIKKINFDPNFRIQRNFDQTFLFSIGYMEFYLVIGPLSTFVRASVNIHL